MVERKRVRSAPTFPSQYIENGNLVTITGYEAGYASITDHVVVGQHAPLNIVKVLEKRGGLVNGTRTIYQPLTFRNYQLYWFRTEQPTHSGWTTETSSSSYELPSSNSIIATLMAARTNPSRPDVDIPVFIAELKDLPELVFHAGKKIVKNAAKGNLWWQFGVLPMISDLRSMLDFVSLTEKRLKELRALQRSGLRRKRNFGSFASHTVTSVPVDTTKRLNIDGTINTTRRCKVWASCRWVPTASFPKTDAALLSLARQAVGGLTIDLATMWELIPFSWLVDYFSTVGSYCMAIRNIVPCVLTGGVDVMRSYEYIANAPLKVDPNSSTTGKLSVSPYFERGIRKTRENVSAISPGARLPFLTARQWSIIASLVILRTGRYYQP